MPGKNWGGSREGAGRESAARKAARAPGQKKVDSFFAPRAAPQTEEETERERVIEEERHREEEDNRRQEEERRRQEEERRREEEERRYQEEAEDARDRLRDLAAQHAAGGGTERAPSGNESDDEENDSDHDSVPGMSGWDRDSDSKSDDEDDCLLDDDDDDDEHDDDSDDMEASQRRRRHRQKYIPPTGSPMYEHLDGIKKKVLDGKIDVRSGCKWVCPKSDPVCTGIGPDPTPNRLHTSNIAVFVFLPLKQCTRLCEDEPTCPFCKRKKTESHCYAYRPAFYWDQIVFILHRRFRCLNLGCEVNCRRGGRRRSFAMIDPRAMSYLPTRVVERFPFVTTPGGPGIHTSMMISLSNLLTKSITLEPARGVPTVPNLQLSAAAVVQKTAESAGTMGVIGTIGQT